jgi:hypothetical protein
MTFGFFILFKIEMTILELFILYCHGDLTTVSEMIKSDFCYDDFEFAPAYPTI